MKAYLLFLTTLFFLTGCSQNPNNDSETKTIAADTITVKPIADTISETAKVEDPINDSIETEEEETGLSFSNKSFFLTTDYDHENCEALARCDCCTSEIFFIDDDRYIFSSMCGGDENFFKGIYEIKESEIKLYHDSLYVYTVTPFGDGEEDSDEYGTFQEREKLEPSTIKIGECDSRLVLNFVNGSYSAFGTEGDSRESLRLLWMNSDSEILNLLELK